MAIRDSRSDTEALRERLANEPPPVAYDVAVGLARHERLLKAPPALPAWATDEPAAQSRFGLRKLGWWLAGTLVVLTAAWRMVPSASPVWPQQVRDAMQGPAPGGASGSGQNPLTRATAEDHASRATEASARALRSANNTTPEREVGLAQARAARVEPIEDAAAVFASHSDTREIGPASGALARGPIAGEVREPSRRRTTGDARFTTTSRLSHSRPEVQEPLDAEEMRQVTRAEELLETAPLEALALVRAGEVKFRAGYFTQERRYLEIMALFALHRRDEAEAQARWFLRDYPDGPYRQRVERARQHATTR